MLLVQVQCRQGIVVGRMRRTRLLNAVVQLLLHEFLQFTRPQGIIMFVAMLHKWLVFGRVARGLPGMIQAERYQVIAQRMANENVTVQ